MMTDSPMYRYDLRRFLSERQSNKWLEYDHFRVYIRKAQRTLPPFRMFFDVIDVANISVQESHQGKGIFTEWLTAAEDIAKETDRIVFVENVLNKKLAGWLERRGYSRMGPVETPCFFLISGRV
jgi:GNAT superfamily N-acetyltransferase